MKNKKEITQYKNQVNSIPMRKWTTEEMNFFFAVLTKLKDEGTREILMNKYELAELAKYTITHNKRYRDTMKNLVDKIGSLTYFEETKNSYEVMPFFLKFRATWKDDLSDMELVLKVNPDFEYILNRWNEGNWTKFMLDEFINIESTYSKTLFRLLKQWRTVGQRKFDLDEFRRLMDIPKSYNVGRINDRIVKNAIRDLEPYFQGLKVKIIKANTKGTPVIGYKFTWNPEQIPEKPEFVDDKYIKKTDKQRKIDKIKNKNNKKSFSEKAREERFKKILEDREI